MSLIDLFLTYDFIIAGIVGAVLGYLYAKILGGEEKGGIMAGIFMGLGMFIGKFTYSMFLDLIIGIFILTASFKIFCKMGLLKSFTGGVILYFGTLTAMGLIGMLLGMPVVS